MVTAQASDELSAVAKARKANVPLHVLLELTYRCNVRCVHCYLAGREREMTRDEIRGLLDQLAGAGCLFLTLSGGEVLLRRDFFEIAGDARERGFALRIFTNGTLIKPGDADRIADLHPVGVEISLLGADAATHDGITQKRGSFDRTLRAVELLAERGVRVKLKTTLMSANVAEAEAMERLAARLGASHQVAFVLMPRRGGDMSPLGLQIDDRALRAYLARRTRDLSEAPLPTSVVEDGLCSAGRAACSISPSGDVYPCVLMPLKAGNVLEQPFETIWQSAPAMQRMRALVDQHRIACQGCDESGHSFCPALNVLETGDPERMSPQASRGQALWRDLAAATD